MSAPILAIEDFSVVYRSPGGDVRAVQGVNLELYASEVVGLVGESGSGKSTLAYGACRLLRAPALITGGSVRYLAPVASSADPSHVTACPFVLPGTPPPAQPKGHPAAASAGADQ